MLNGSNCDRKLQLSGILTELLNPRDLLYFKYILKGVFAKNERGYRLNAIKKRF